MVKTKKNAAIDPNLTLAGLSAKYAEQLAREGKSLGTQFSYGAELRLAEAELGSDTLVASLTAADVEKFNRSKRVNRLKSGKVKSPLSVAKSQRVLRLALAFGEQHGLIERSPIAAKVEPANDTVPESAPAKKTRKSRVVAEERAPAEAPTENANTDASTEASAA